MATSDVCSLLITDHCFKAASGKTGIDYEESVEEALCFGWVDSIIQKIDDERYARKFNPRRKGSPWSASNKARMEKLVRENRMTAAGLDVFDLTAPESVSETGLKIRRGEMPIPPDIQQKSECKIGRFCTEVRRFAHFRFGKIVTIISPLNTLHRNGKMVKIRVLWNKMICF